MRVCFFIWGLRAAGAERVLSFLANAWAARGWEVTVLTMENGDQPPFYPLAAGVQVRPLDLLQDSGSFLAGLTRNARRILRLRRALREVSPDVVISFIDKANILAVFASRGLGIPVVISERTDPSRRTLGRAWNALRDLAYPRADALVFQSKAVLAWFPPRVRRKGLVIPNPVQPPPPGARAVGSERGPFRIVAIGRLAPVKGFDLLLRAFARLLPRFPEWKLDIWGEGPERQALEALAAELQVQAAVRFPGLTERPFEVLREADLFVLSSRAEGFPNALVEAMACGLPVIATDFGGAAREIVHDGIDGRLVPSEDPAALAEAMAELMSNPEARERLAAQAPAVVETFSPARVLEAWDGALRRVLRHESGKARPEGGACPT